MDFRLDEAQEAVADLASQILTDKVTPERLAEIEASAEWFDRDVWRALADAGLVGIALADDVGGGGLDLVASGLVLRAQGATVAPVPLLPTGLAALAVDHFGSPEQRHHLLPGVVAGDTVLSLAIQEPHDDRVRQPSAEVAGGRLTGRKSVVEFAEHAERLVVTARAETGPSLFLVDPAGPGVTMTAGRSTRLEPVHLLDFDDAPAEPLAGGDGSAVGWLVDRVVVSLAATQLGVTGEALRMTAAYTSTREQFGRPIATFQAVTQRLADQYVNVAGIELTTLAALWQLANGLDAHEDVRIAKFWASQRATEVAHATQHCHGGMGVSVEYPLHRYTLWNKHLTTSLGAGTQQLRDLGAALASA